MPASLVNAVTNIDGKTCLVAVPVLVVLAHVIPWLVDVHGIRSYPGPFWARFTDLWLGWVAAQGHRSEVVHEMHNKYGACRPNQTCCFTLIETCIPSRCRANRSHSTQPYFHLRPRSSTDCLCTRQRLAQIRVLRRFRLNPPWSLQHSRPRSPCPQA